VRVDRMASEWHFVVKDTGVGIPADKLGGFERFSQIGTNDRKGVGLGLYGF